MGKKERMVMGRKEKMGKMGRMVKMERKEKYKRWWNKYRNKRKEELGNRLG